ncbi:MAG: lamin tail domain-containing protein [Phototrophicaceae bacterium]|jgi:LysM repeat protein
MRRRSPVSFIFLNILLPAAIAFGILYFFPFNSQSGQTFVPVTVQYIVTSTPDRDGVATQVAQSVAATVAVMESELVAVPVTQSLPDGIASEIANSPTLSPEVAEDATVVSDAAASLAASLPSGCIVHVVESGDTPFGIADQYGASGPALMLVNGLTEETASGLQIGDALIIPLPNCPIEEILPTVAPTEPAPDALESSLTVAVTGPASTLNASGTITVTLTLAPSRTATPVLAPTATNAQVEITQVIGPGDITAEGIEIRNRGGVIDLTGWTLTDAQGNQFVFPEQRLFTNGLVTVYTRVGENTPIALYWGRSSSAWGDAGDIATLANGNGLVQSVVRVR